MAYLIGAMNPANSFDYMEQYGKADLLITNFWEGPSYNSQDDTFVTYKIEPSLYVEQGTIDFLIQPRVRVGNSGAGRVDLKEAHI